MTPPLPHWCGLVALYQRQLVKCVGINHFNRLHVATENRATPCEMQDIIDATDLATGHPAELGWLKKMREQMSASGKPAPEPFVRFRVRPNLYLYTAGGEPAVKTLAICFTGGARRLMMPIPTFLQHLDGSRFDVLLISRHGDSDYATFVRGLAGSFEELTEVLHRAYRGRGYRRVVSYGTSAGGLPALLTAVRLGLDTGVAIGGGSLQADIWTAVREAGWLQRARESRAATPRLLAVYGANNERDRIKALEIAAVLPVTLCPLPGQKSHAAIFNYVGAGTFGALLDRLLSAAESRWSTTWRAMARPLLGRLPRDLRRRLDPRGAVFELGNLPERIERRVGQ